MKGDAGLSSDPQMLPRIKEVLRNVPGQKPEEVAYDLQQKYPLEYGRKKFRPFVNMVQDEMNRLTIGSQPPRDEMDADNSSAEVITIDDSQPTTLDLQEKLANTIKAKSQSRKRKKNNSLVINARSEVVVSSDEENAKWVDNVKTPNRANKMVANLYNKVDATKEKKDFDNAKGQHRKSGAPPPASAKPSTSQPRNIGNAASFSVEPRQSTVRFDDLGGCDRQFLEVCRLAMHMKRPKTYELLGVEPPKGFLVHGPPGCGKTMFAQAVAGEFNLPLLQLAATELVSGVSGDTEDKIRQLFEIAKQNAPCVLVLDDIDAIAPRRETSSREMERRIVSQLCNSLDELFGPRKEKPLHESLKFDSEGGVTLEDSSSKATGPVLVIGTTSRPDAIDGGLRRAGRFDSEISIGIPDEHARIKILNTICKLPLDESVNMLMVARLTPGYVGADLNALVRETAKCAVNRIFDTIVCRHTSKRSMTNEEVHEELNKVLSWLNGEDDPAVMIPRWWLGGFHVLMNDFERALENVQPSAKREGFATVPDVTWDEIGALSDVRLELEWTILHPIKRPEDFAILGISTKPNGILLCGPPGCGKTLLAKAVANETGMNFISVKGPELLNMYVGESERAVRTVFQRARDSSPCVIFFDEIDALCPKRSGNETTGGARLVNQLLTEMDGVEGRKQVFLIGATNRPDIVDPAILRPGRLDKIFFVDFPSADDRIDILRKTTKNGTKPKLSSDVSFEELARMEELDGFTSADLAALVHEAAIVALKERLFANDTSVDAVGMVHFKKAAERIRPSVSVTDRKKYAKMREVYAAQQK